MKSANVVCVYPACLQSFYRQYTTVTINPSVSMRDFLSFMSGEGVSLPAYPSVDTTSVAGLLATGAHVRRAPWYTF